MRVCRDQQLTPFQLVSAVRPRACIHQIDRVTPGVAHCRPLALDASVHSKHASGAGVPSELLLSAPTPLQEKVTICRTLLEVLVEEASAVDALRMTAA